MGEDEGGWELDDKRLNVGCVIGVGRIGLGKDWLCEGCWGKL